MIIHILFIYILVDRHPGFPNFCLLQIVLLWTFLNKLFEYLFSILILTLGVGLLDHRVLPCLTFRGTAKILLQWLNNTLLDLKLLLNGENSKSDQLWPLSIHHVGVVLIKWQWIKDFTFLHLNVIYLSRENT